MTKAAQECASHALCICETDKQRNSTDLFIPVTEADACCFAAQTLDGTCRRFPCLLSKQAGELTNAQASGLGKTIDR